MAERNDASGPVILWLNYHSEGWQPRSYDTLTEALNADRYGSPFVVTKLVNYEVTEVTRNVRWAHEKGGAS